MPSSPFSLKDKTAYARWRDAKLAGYPQRLDELLVEIRDPYALTAVEREALVSRIRSANLAIYIVPERYAADRGAVRALGRQLGLEHLDHNEGADADDITSLAVQEDAYHRHYIPYTDRPIAWHTDGYYNTLDRQIHGMVLHCARPAAKGGENQLLDHELVYIALRDQDPACIEALMRPDTMTIPPNVVKGVETRPVRSGPVFWTAPDGHLHMRYTDRKRNVVWSRDAGVSEAVAALKDLLHRPIPYEFRALLQRGQGVVCNNVLHTRTGFTDGEPGRLLFRARSFDRVAGT